MQQKSNDFDNETEKGAQSENYIRQIFWQLDWHRGCVHFHQQIEVSSISTLPGLKYAVDGGSNAVGIAVRARITYQCCV